jgi:hypothetical protein
VCRSALKVHLFTRVVRRAPPFLGVPVDECDVAGVTRTVDRFISGRHTWQVGKEIPTPKLTSHIPNKGQVLQRYYGWYSSRLRGKRRQAAGQNDGYEEPPLVTVEPEPEALRETKRRWAELLRRIFEVDPLKCPRCDEEMRIVSFITEPKTIDRILEHLRRTRASRRRQRAPPRRWKSAASTSST